MFYCLGQEDVSHAVHDSKMSCSGITFILQISDCGLSGKFIQMYLYLLCKICRILLRAAKEKIIFNSDVSTLYIFCCKNNFLF